MLNVSTSDCGSIILPDSRAVQAWLLETIIHSMHVEYQAEILQKNERIIFSDPQRPHDIMGPMNKFEREIIKGLALQYIDDNKIKNNDICREQIFNAIVLHR
jgi:hypothetical protein